MVQEHSAGILIKMNSGYLACHPTLKSKVGPYWDIPKGHIEHGETAKDAMFRELKEETGIVLSHLKITDCGVMEYTKNKDLHMFYADLTHYNINVQDLKCTSYFSLHGRDIPEMNDYMITRDLSVYYSKLQPILRQVIDMQR